MNSQEGLLLLNIGTPKSPSTEDVSVYLKEFLGDPEVINLPGILRLPLVHFLIVPRRAPASAKKYQAIWTEHGSPLMVHSENLAKKLEQHLQKPVRLGMRYGHPSIRASLQELAALGVKTVKLVPMFPQYAEATTGSALGKVKAEIKALNLTLQTEVVPEYFHRPEFHKATTDVALTHLGSIQSSLDQFDHVLFSFHGLPKAQVTKDPACKLGACCNEEGAQRRCYRAQCVQTAKALAQQMGVKDYSVSFQSRLGPVKWIEPYTDFHLKGLAQKGVKSVLVLCPSFSADCLETLEEIAIEMKHIFLSEGGQNFVMAPCPNSDDIWVQALAQIVESR
jgi:ferrochelatase